MEFLDNPFSDYGSIVHNNRFIGRVIEKKLILNRLFGSNGYGSIALVGLPRIGKSSLAFSCIEEAEKLNLVKKRKAALVRIEAGTCDTAQSLFRLILSEVNESVKINGWSNHNIEEIGLESISSVERNDPDFFTKVKRFFGALVQNGIRPVCFIDEFDVVRRLFKGEAHYFHKIRELCSNPPYKVGFVLISKRNLSSIARLSGQESNYWSNVLKNITLRPFESQEIDLVFEKLRSDQIETDSELMEQISVLIGGHPYLLDATCYFLWESKNNLSELKADWLMLKVGDILRQYYSELTTILKETEMFGKFIQYFHGPSFDLTPNDIDEMIAYGVVKSENSGHIVPFLEGFLEFSRYQELRDDFWSLWTSVEKLLREGLEKKLVQVYGDKWMEVLAKQSNLKVSITQMEVKMQKDRRLFSTGADISPLSYAYPRELFQIACHDWSQIGAPLFGNDKQHWNHNFTILSKVRTPFAHSRETVVSPSLVTQAEGICKEINDVSHDWNFLD